VQGYNATLVKDKKKELIPYGFHIGFYIVKGTPQYKKEGLSQGIQVLDRPISQE
jgi:hypothetical protein